MADATTATPGVAGRERVRAEAGAGYRTFPARVPAVLAVLAGALALLGGLGAALRASAIAAAREQPKQVGAVMGYREGAGRVLAILGVLLIASALAWLGRRAVPRLAAAAVSILFVLLVVSRLSALDERAADWARAVRTAPDFVAFHAGLGWGAWYLLVAAILAGFAVLVGGLRELDLRRGIPG